LPNSSTISRGQPIIFGEVLFDRFSDSQTVLGGAPFNVAWHLQGLGLDPLFISRIGQDSSGRKVLEIMSSWGMDTGGLQLDSLYPTGTVQVDIKNEEPHYTIMPDQAYDNIDSVLALQAAEQIVPSLLYTGSLALRSVTSRRAWQQLSENTGLPIFTDINLREPWWTPEILEEILKQARWVKMNEQELAALIQRDQVDKNNIAEVSSRMCRELNCSLLVITRGARGALMTSGQETWQGEPVTVKKLVDTVGAGDAFSAVNIAGIILGWEPPVILERSLEFASKILEIRGATTDNISLYNDFTRRWKI